MSAGGRRRRPDIRPWLSCRNAAVSRGRDLPARLQGRRREEREERPLDQAVRDEPGTRRAQFATPLPRSSPAPCATSNAASAAAAIGAARPTARPGGFHRQARTTARDRERARPIPRTTAASAASRGTPTLSSNCRKKKRMSCHVNGVPANRSLRRTLASSTATADAARHGGEARAPGDEVDGQAGHRQGLRAELGVDPGPRERRKRQHERVDEPAPVDPGHQGGRDRQRQRGVHQAPGAGHREEERAAAQHQPAERHQRQRRERGRSLARRARRDRPRGLLPGGSLRTAARRAEMRRRDMEDAMMTIA